MITPILRDDLLKSIITKRKGIFIDLDARKLAEELNVEVAFVDAILAEFTNDGLISMSQLSDSDPCYHVTLTAKAIEHSENNWYQAKAALEELQIEKLIEDLAFVKSQIGLAKYNAIVATLTMVMGFFSLESSK